MSKRTMIVTLVLMCTAAAISIVYFVKEYERSGRSTREARREARKKMCRLERGDYKIFKVASDFIVVGNDCGRIQVLTPFGSYSLKPGKVKVRDVNIYFMDDLLYSNGTPLFQMCHSCKLEGVAYGEIPEIDLNCQIRNDGINNPTTDDSIRSRYSVENKQPWVPCDTDGDDVGECGFYEECLDSDKGSCDCLLYRDNICIKWEADCSCQRRDVCGNGIWEADEDCDEFDDINCLKDCRCREGFEPDETGGCQLATIPSKWDLRDPCQIRMSPLEGGNFYVGPL